MLPAWKSKFYYYATGRITEPAIGGLDRGSPQLAACFVQCSKIRKKVQTLFSLFSHFWQFKIIMQSPVKDLTAPSTLKNHQNWPKIEGKWTWVKRRITQSIALSQTVIRAYICYCTFSTFSEHCGSTSIGRGSSQMQMDRRRPLEQQSKPHTCQADITLSKLTESRVGRENHRNFKHGHDKIDLCCYTSSSLSPPSEHQKIIRPLWKRETLKHKILKDRL